jgi:hypothetical protein
MLVRKYRPAQIILFQFQQAVVRNCVFAFSLGLATFEPVGKRSDN